MPAVEVTILLLRHGQSEWNSQRRWQGTADSPLTALGRTQARTAAEVLSGLGRPFAGVWSSDLRRASQTAAVIAAALGLGEPVVDPRLREAHAGEWEGLTPDEIEVRWPGWLESHRRPATFEPYADVVSRAEESLSEIAQKVAAMEVAAMELATTESATALVVSHSGVVRSMIRHLGAQDGRVPNLGGIWLRASVIGDRSILVLGDLFDPSGIVVSGIDAPGEDPGE
jgi:broad specificity phosphatase PhoE